METSYIPEFLALAEFGSSYMAAEKLFVSQSTLLRHVQSIEDEFGVPLFERTRKGFVLNREGQIFLPYARQIANLKKHCYDAIHRDEDQSKSIRLCAEGKIIDLMIDFRKAYPDYILDYNKNENAEDALFEGRIDVAFLANLKPKHEGLFNVINYSKEEVLAVLYEDHPLAQKEAVTLEELRKEDFIQLADEVAMDDMFYDHGQNRNMPNVVAVVPTGSDLLRMIRKKCGVGIMHGRMSTTPSAEGLKVLPLDPRIEYELNVYYQKDVMLNSAVEQFLDFTKRWVKAHPEMNQSLID